jgi:hypothetical protein
MSAWAVAACAEAMEESQNKVLHGQSSRRSEVPARAITDQSCARIPRGVPQC